MRVLIGGAFAATDPVTGSLLPAWLDGLEGHDVCLAGPAPAALSQRFGCRAVALGSPAATARAVAACDALVFLGGPELSDRPLVPGGPPWAITAAALAGEARALGKRVAFVGVGVGELQRPLARAGARLSATRADLFVVRDERSAATLAAGGAPVPMWVGTDPVWLAALEPPAGSRPDGTVVVVLAGRSASEERLTASALAQVQAGRRVVLLPWGEHGYDAVGRAAAVLGEARVLPSPGDLTEARAVFMGAGSALATEEHARIAAGWAGVSCIDPGGRRLPAPDPSAIKAERLRAEECLRLLRVVLADGRSDEADAISGLELGPGPWPS